MAVSRLWRVASKRDARAISYNDHRKEPRMQTSDTLSRDPAAITRPSLSFLTRKQREWCDRSEIARWNVHRPHSGWIDVSDTERIVRFEGIIWRNFRVKNTTVVLISLNQRERKIRCRKRRNRRRAQDASNERLSWQCTIVKATTLTTLDDDNF